MPPFIINASFEEIGQTGGVEREVARMPDVKEVYVVASPTHLDEPVFVKGFLAFMDNTTPEKALRLSNELRELSTIKDVAVFQAARVTP